MAWPVCARTGLRGYGSAAGARQALRRIEHDGVSRLIVPCDDCARWHVVERADRGEP